MKFKQARVSPLVRAAELAGALLLAALLSAFSATWTRLGLRRLYTEPPGWDDQSPGVWGVSQAGLAAAQEACEQPAVVTADPALLDKFGCGVLKDSCLDQSRILIHTGQKTPGHEKWTAKPLFKFAEFPEIVLPGYPESSEQSHYMPARYALDIRAPTPKDPADVWQPPAFSNCTVPLIFWPHYLSLYSEFFAWRLTALFHAHREGVFDRNVLFAPDTNGMRPPHFYGTHLAPFTRHAVESLTSLSSRENIHVGRGRCYSSLLLCNLHRHDGQKEVARAIMDYYKAQHPEAFQAAADSSFRVAFLPPPAGPDIRSIVNQGEVLEQCRQWKPPPTSRFTAVECFVLEGADPRPDVAYEDASDQFVQLLAQLERADALVSTPSHGMNYGFFLRNGTGVVEVLCSTFCSKGADMYYKQGMEVDQSMRTGYFRLTADKEHCLPGEFERNRTGSNTYYARDKNIRLEFSALQHALAQIALGEVHSVAGNFGERNFAMVNKEPAC